LVEIIAPGSFKAGTLIGLPPEEVSRLPKAPGVMAQPKQVRAGGSATFVTIGLSDEDLKKLEEAAKELGLEVPKDLRKTYTVRAEGAEKVKESFRKKLNAFIEQLKKKWEEQQKQKQQEQQPQVITTTETQVFYEIGLNEEDLKKLEEAAKELGLEVPESLKTKRVVSAEEKDEAVAELQKELNAFISELQQAYERIDYENTIMRLRGMADAYQRRHPGSQVFINDAGFLVIVDPAIAISEAQAVIDQETQALNEDQLMKEARGEKLLEESKSSEGNLYRGYELYYEGLRTLRKELDLMSVERDKISVHVDPSQLSHPRARARGLSADVEIDLGKEEIQQEQIKLYSDQTMTWEEIQKNQEAWTKVETISGAVAEAVYDEDDSAAERFIKGLGVGAITFFTWPLDIIMTAAQWDEIQRAAAAEGKSVKRFLAENILESLHKPETWGEITGSLLTSYGVTKLVRFTTPKVYEEPGGLSGYRQIVHEIKVDGDDLARAIRTEAFDYDEVTRITLKNRIFGPKEITVEKIPRSFTAKVYEAITASDDVASTTRILEAPLGPDDVHIANVRIGQMVSAGDDFMRFTETSTKILVNTEDIMNFLKEAQKGGKAPNELIKIVEYSTDDATRTIITKEIYDDIVKTNIEIKNFQDDIVKALGKGKGKGGAGGSLDDIIKVSADDVVKPSAAPGGGGSSAGGQQLLLDDALKQLDNVAFKVTEKTGERVLVSSGDNIIIPPGWVPDISGRPKDIDIDIEKGIDDILGGEGTSSKRKSKGKQDQDLDVDISTNYESSIRTIMLEREGESFDFSAGITETPIYKQITKTETRTLDITDEDIDLDFNIREVTDEMTRLSQEVRQLYGVALLEPALPRPKPKKAKVKESPRKRMRVGEKKKKRSRKKKSKREKGGEWAWWVGYESLFDY